jgi:hypothetical protein
VLKKQCPEDPIPAEIEKKMADIKKEEEEKAKIAEENRRKKEEEAKKRRRDLGVLNFH